MVNPKKCALCQKNKSKYHTKQGDWICEDCLNKRYNHNENDDQEFYSWFTELKEDKER